MLARSEYHGEALDKFKSHPQYGADMLSGKPYISGKILALVAAHEEMGHGSGFPNKVNLFGQPLHFQILSFANKFDHFVVENEYSFKDAISPFQEKYKEQYTEELFNYLDQAIDS